MRIQSPADAARVMKTQRLRRGLTQQAVAEAVGITRQSYARVEQAHGGASFATYLKIFEFLGVALDGEVTQAESRDTSSGRDAVAGTSHDFLRGLGQEAAEAAFGRLAATGALASAVQLFDSATRDVAEQFDPTALAQGAGVIQGAISRQSRESHRHLAEPRETTAQAEAEVERVRGDDD